MKTQVFAIASPSVNQSIYPSTHPSSGIPPCSPAIVDCCSFIERGRTRGGFIPELLCGIQSLASIDGQRTPELFRTRQNKQLASEFHSLLFFLLLLFHSFLFIYLFFLIFGAIQVTWWFQPNCKSRDVKSPPEIIVFNWTHPLGPPSLNAKNALLICILICIRQVSANQLISFRTNVHASDIHRPHHLHILTRQSIRLLLLENLIAIRWMLEQRCQFMQIRWQRMQMRLDLSGC